jgi:hypothetical protein
MAINPVFHKAIHNKYKKLVRINRLNVDVDPRIIDICVIYNKLMTNIELRNDIILTQAYGD